MSGIVPHMLSAADQPGASDFERDAVAGLSSSPRTLPCKYFYDERGAALFRKICELPEYYITRAETEILATDADEIAALLGPRCQIVGLGTGGGRKTRMLLSHLADPVAYVPIDVDDSSLATSAAQLAEVLPTLEVQPLCADFMEEFTLPRSRREADRIVVYFPGSTVGNLEPQTACHFLERLVKICGPGGGLLIGVDLQKAPEVIERAYNDAAGVTAEFNLNLLVRANRELGANFDLAQWQHRAIYNPLDGRIEMHLISTARQRVRLGEHQFDFEAGEWIVTEYSYKHSRDGFIGLARSAGFDFRRLWTDRAQLFGLFYLVVPH
jgi:dimethylhistidine N-methyltransferase